MKKLFVASGAALLLLTGCGQGQGEDGNKAHSQQEKVSQLSENQRLALAFYDNNSKDYMLSKNDILTGFYTYKGQNGDEKRQINYLVLQKVGDVDNAPKGMKFYTVHPQTREAESVIGVSKTKLFIGSTQAQLQDYSQMLNNGKEIKVKDLYKKHKNHRAWPELTTKVTQAKQEPDTDSAAALPTTMAHMRSQIHQMIQDFEGHPIDNQYLWDNVSFDDPKHPDVWTMKYRNQDGELLGSYSPAKDGQIVKYDQNGNEIARKYVKVKDEVNE
ncbi:hypothetical protein [Staphylococcus pettenkoferi]|uniref:hypothetical protein n=1 Tax=Staphylococcus pettenkoferi TaxID=170573 RepID=UPI0011AA1014|nr:hypothetical protein [Staphylococcus pettenkoferi]